ncbi:O-antigen/teichoic acid export membrane protein [Mesorhizobium soli]|uniref:oligosaccharide flippase family protein n=1 Tax=Pseudaminobacter soli (ex Li et al. 2025) TaxID=1295366 RepID=UPI002475BE77|nr:oligosaccharide flippase family protein [Mesorhizobium soli]MDH6229815.1 O-antigen/teichoic acid export membrane protein [Mesorhizobium soli]
MARQDAVSGRWLRMGSWWMAGIRRVLLLSTSDRYVALILNFLTVAVVSRILTPSEIGISVVGMAIVGFASSAREFASTSFLIQHRELAREDIQSAFTVMLGFTLVIVGGLAVFARPLASAFGQAGLVPYLRIISLCMLIDVFPTLIVALLRREMAFGKVAIINMGGAIVTSVTTIILARQGFSYMSFAGAGLANACLTALLAIAIYSRLSIFRPTLRHWRRMVAFGGYNGLTAFMFKAYEMVPYLLLGNILAPHAAALFSRATMICQIPDRLVLSGTIPAILPIFSASVREGQDLKKPYLNALEIVTALQWPALLAIALLADPVVGLVLGGQWQDTVPLVRIIAIASLFSFSAEIGYPVMVSLGAIRDVCIRALIAYPASLAILLVATAVGGLHAAAWSMLIITPLQAYLSLTFLRRRLGLRWRELFAAVGRSALVAVASATCPALVLVLSDLSSAPSILQVAVSGIFAAAGWLLALRATRHPLLQEVGHAYAAIRRMVRLAPTQPAE